MKFLKNLSILHKLVGIVAMLVIPLAVATWFFYVSHQHDIAFTEKERTGAQYLKALFPVWTAVAQHRSGSLQALRAESSP